MTAQSGPCLRCSRHTRLRLDFCQRCEGKTTEAERIAFRRDAWLRKAMYATIAKLEANAVHIAARRRIYATLGAVRPLAEADRKRIITAVEENVRSLEAERPVLVAKIVRQGAYIDMLRRKAR